MEKFDCFNVLFYHQGITMVFSIRTIQRKTKRAFDSVNSNLQNKTSSEDFASYQATLPTVGLQVPEIANNVSDTFDPEICTDTVPELQINADSYIPHDYENDSNKSFDSDSETSERENDLSDYESEFDINTSLRDWATSFNISLAAVTALLHILWLAGLSVPKDSRTLLQTPKSAEIKQIPGGNYYHFGIENGIVTSLRKKLNLTNFEIKKLSLNVNIDGLPLFRSSRMQLWPILGTVVELPKADIFIIGLYAGSSKPLCVTTFLNDFIIEMKHLLQNGVRYLDQIYPIVVNAIICDAPARSYIKQIKGHGGYNACERCTEEGTYLNNKMTYPNLHASLRTDDDFVRQKDEDHHLPNRQSPLIELNIGLVSKCPLDYMHLTCLGIVRRIVSLWLEGDLHYRLPARVVNDISVNLIKLRSYLPREFARQPRSILEYKQWKATEFRQFMLYLGAVVLRDAIPINMYQNFLTFSVAMICLLRPEFANSLQYCDYAEKLLLMFVTDFGTIYGASQLIYNVHSVIHLPQDCRNFGALDKISSFPFENFLGQIKKMVRRPQNPIAQVMRRYYEKEHILLVAEKNSNIQKNVPSKEHFTGPVPPNFSHEIYRQYKHFKTDNIFISSTVGNNCFEILGKLSIVRNILQTSKNDIFIIYNEFIDLKPFFHFPLDSTHFEIFLAAHLSTVLKFVQSENIGKKFVNMPYGDNFVLMPLLHQV